MLQDIQSASAQAGVWNVSEHLESAAPRDLHSVLACEVWRCHVKLFRGEVAAGIRVFDSLFGVVLRGLVLQAANAWIIVIIGKYASLGRRLTFGLGGGNGGTKFKACQGPSLYPMGVSRRNLR